MGVKGSSERFPNCSPAGPSQMPDGFIPTQLQPAAERAGGSLGTRRLQGHADSLGPAASAMRKAATPASMLRCRFTRIELPAWT